MRDSLQFLSRRISPGCHKSCVFISYLGNLAAVYHHDNKQYQLANMTEGKTHRQADRHAETDGKLASCSPLHPNCHPAKFVHIQPDWISTILTDCTACVFSKRSIGLLSWLLRHKHSNLWMVCFHNFPMLLPWRHCLSVPFNCLHILENTTITTLQAKLQHGINYWMITDGSNFKG